MPLHRLPPEILLHILRLLGSAFFRQDVRRLVVSRWWYCIAWPVLLQNLDFSAESLRGFVLASRRVGAIPSMQSHVKTVSLSFDGFENWHSVQSGSRNTPPSSVDFHAVRMWTSELNDCLASLASILQQCTRLHSLAVTARPERHDPRLGLQRRNYLMAFSVASLVSLSHLTCLEIDTAGTHITGQGDLSRMHLCDNISKMLLTLRRLRCRMSRICPHIIADRGRLSTLEDVIINLSLSELSVSDTSYRYPIRCGAIFGDNFPQLKADMELHARELVHGMDNPHIVRIVSHTFPGLAMHSFDAIAGRRMELASAAPWDADGEEVEERAAPKDNFDSDSSSEVLSITL